MNPTYRYLPRPLRSSALVAMLASLLASWVTLRAHAQPAPPLESVDPALPSAIDLLDQAVVALGGAERLASIESYRVEAEAVQRNPAMLGVPERDFTASGEMLWRRDGYARMRGACEQYDTATHEVWMRRIENGIRPGCSWSRVPDRTRELFGRLPTAMDGTAQFDPMRIVFVGIARHRETLLEARTVRREQVAGKECLKVMARLRYRPDDAPKTTAIWLDAATSRPVLCSVGATRTRYADWREVDGVFAPYKITAGMLCGDPSGGMRNLAVVKVLTFNSVTPEDVSPPANLREMAELVADEQAQGR